MTKRKIDIRLDEDLVEWLERYAARRRWNRSQALQEAVLVFKDREEGRGAEGSDGGHRDASP